MFNIKAKLVCNYSRDRLQNSTSVEDRFKQSDYDNYNGTSNVKKDMNINKKPHKKAQSIITNSSLLRAIKGESGQISTMKMTPSLS